MDAILVRERYKVVRVTDSREDYAFAEAVDILDREMPGCLLNLYEGPLLRRYLPYFHQMEGFAALQGIFLDGKSLVAVSRDCGGVPIDQVFFLGDSHGWRERLYYAGELCRQVLNLADVAPDVACALLLSDNVRVDEKDRRICLRFHVLPMEGMNGREAVYLAGDQIYKILHPRMSSPREELTFLDELRAGQCVSVVQLYSLWRGWEEKIRQAYEAMEKKNFIRRWFGLLLGRIRWKAERRKRR